MDIPDEDITRFRRELRALEREIVLELKSQTTCCGVTLAQCHLLLELSDRESASLTDLAKSMGLDKSTQSRMLDGLVESGLAERTRGAGDRRLQRIGLTGEGKSKVSSINTLCNDYYRELLARMPGAKVGEIMETVALLSRGMAALRRHESSESPCCGENQKEGQRCPV